MFGLYQFKPNNSNSSANLVIEIMKEEGYSDSAIEMARSRLKGELTNDEPLYKIPRHHKVKPIRHLIPQKESQNETKEKDCLICLEEISSKPFYELTTCKHLFHIKCLEKYIIERIKSRGFPIRCPLQNCKLEICENDVINCIQTKLEYQRKYHKLSLQTYLDANPHEYYHCQTPGCKFYCSLDLQGGPKLDCPKCKKSYCVKCKTEWHFSLRCEKFQQLKRDQGDDVFLKYADKKGLKRCPKCQIFVEKIEGCNAMECLTCKAHFCYGCGREGDGHNCLHSN